MESKTLRYQVELALNGMKDGPPSDHLAPARLEQLLTYKNAWPALTWSREDRLEISRPTIMGVSSGFFYHASENSDHDFQWTLELYELLSFRTSRNASPLRRFKFNVSYNINDVVIDLSQNLLVLVELDQPNGYVYFSNLSDCCLSISNVAAQILSALVFVVMICGHSQSIQGHRRIYSHCKPIGGVRYARDNMFM
jgi:hypothetical protein